MTMDRIAFFKGFVKTILDGDGVAAPQIEAKDVVILPGGRVAVSCLLVQHEMDGHFGGLQIFRGFNVARLKMGAALTVNDLGALGSGLNGVLYVEEGRGHSLGLIRGYTLDFRGYILPEDSGADFVGCLIEAIAYRLGRLEGRREDLQISNRLELSPHECVSVGRCLLSLGIDYLRKQEASAEMDIDPGADESPARKKGKGKKPGKANVKGV